MFAGFGYPGAEGAAFSALLDADGSEGSEVVPDGLEEAVSEVGVMRGLPLVVSDEEVAEVDEVGMGSEGHVGSIGFRWCYGKQDLKVVVVVCGSAILTKTCDSGSGAGGTKKGPPPRGWPSGATSRRTPCCMRRNRRVRCRSTSSAGSPRPS